jgi:hypothetical protein
MARSDIEYTGFIDWCDFRASGNVVVGRFYQRAPGGFDLYLSLVGSELPRLEPEKVTWLRQQADSAREIFIEHFPARKWTPLVRRRGRRRLTEWAATTLSVQPTLGERITDGLVSMGRFLRELFYSPF